MSSSALPIAVLVAVPYAYGGVALLAAGLARVDLLGDTRFSRRKFYFLMGWAPALFAVLAALVDVRYLALLVVGGAAGVAGELLMSVLWRGFFREPIWTYGYGSRVGGYTSTLNFLPWAVGGLLFHETSRLLGAPAGPPARPMLVAAGAFAIALAPAWAARRLTRAGREGRFSRGSFALFCAPIAATAAALAVACDARYLLAMAAFGVVGGATEYGYGRGMSVFFERGLWTYNHARIDGGHTSWVTLPLWTLGGLYFHFLGICLGLPR